MLVQFGVWVRETVGEAWRGEETKGEVEEEGEEDSVQRESEIQHSRWLVHLWPIPQWQPLD